jgi:uncharacterized membrane protein YebE (DUF533 family)
LLGGLLGGGRSTSNTSTAGLGGAGGLGGLLGGLLGGGGLGAGLGGGNGLGSGGAASGMSSRSGGSYAALASLGMMAFQAWQTWQRQQASTSPQATPQPAVRTVDMLAGPEAEVHSHGILCALIGAAKADGHIDAQEEQMISAEIARHTDDIELQQWLEAEVAKPLNAREVASAASEPGIAAEMYLASVLLVDDQQPAERDYLDELAAALQLDPALQAQLESQAKGTAQA